jgi:RecA-family ATPase
MLDAREVIDFVREISWLQPSLVIIDTLARCMIGGDENSARDMGLFVEACSRVQKTGAAVMVIHHTGKNSATGPRGSSALFGAADTIIELSNDDGLIQLRCEKSKDAKPFEDRYIV